MWRAEKKLKAGRCDLKGTPAKNGVINETGHEQHLLRISHETASLQKK
jgi:hypothetical protein